MPIRLCDCGFSGAIRTALRACTSASPSAPRPSSSRASSFVAPKLFGSNATMRRSQCFGRGLLALRLADFVQHGQRTDAIGCLFQDLQAQAFRDVGGALAMGLDRPLDQRHQVATRLRRRQSGDVETATTDGAQATPALAERSGRCLHHGFIVQVQSAVWAARKEFARQPGPLRDPPCWLSAEPGPVQAHRRDLRLDKDDRRLAQDACAGMRLCNLIRLPKL